MLLSFDLLMSLTILAFLVMVKGVPDNERDKHKRQTNYEIDP